LQEGKYDEAEKYINASLKINPDYPNANLTLSLIFDKQEKLYESFSQVIKSLQSHKKNDQIQQGMLSQAYSVSRKLIGNGGISKTLSNFRHKLEFDCGKEIDLVEDDTIETPAKIEFAENFNRDNHTLRFKSGFPAIEHLIMHELFHLKLVIDARKEQINQLFISSSDKFRLFNSDYSTQKQKMVQKGYPEESVKQFMKMMFDGLNLQIYNTPIDLFIEQYIHDEFEELRPWQFISLTKLIENGISAVTDSKVLAVVPPDIISKTKILNLVNAIQFQELYGINYIDKHKPSKIELKQAEQLYNEFLEYRDNKEPAEEYELIQNWGEDLKLNKYFELVGEVQYRKRTNIEGLLESIENDPLGIKDRDPIKEREERKFKDWQDKKDEVDMSIVMYMVTAIQYLNKLSDSDVKKIAYDIAMQGTQGYSPKKDGYKISSIPDKEFTGSQILAWFYVSWAVAMPDAV